MAGLLYWLRLTRSRLNERENEEEGGDWVLPVWVGDSDLSHGPAREDVSTDKNLIVTVL